MTAEPDRHARAQLPIPDRSMPGLTTYDGYEFGTAVTADYQGGDSRFTGKIVWVWVDLGDDDHGYAVDPEERLRVAVARR